MIGIVGGGLSGLFVLHGLRAHGIDALLLEEGERVGGVVRTLRLPEGPADVGPVRLRRTPGLAGVMDELGLEDEQMSAPPETRFHMFRDGRLHPVPLSPAQAIGTPLVSRGGKLRALRDLVSSPPHPGETVEAALVRKLGREVYRVLAGPLLGGLYASDPGRMEARDTLVPMMEGLGGGRSLLVGLLRARRAAAYPVMSLRSGAEALPQALGRLHADCIRTGSPVQGLDTAHGGFHLHTPDGSVAVRQVVLTVPASRAAVLLGEVAPEAADRLAKLRYNPLAVVPMEGELPGGGSGFKVALDEPLALRGVTSRKGLGGEEAIVTAYLGGMGRETLLARPDDRLALLAAREFETVTGAEARALAVERVSVPAWDTSWRALDGLALPPGVHLCAAYSRRPGVIGRLLDAERLVTSLARDARAAAHLPD